MLARVLLFLLALTCYAHASALVPVVTSPQGPSLDCNLQQPYGAAINAGCPGATYTGPSLATQRNASGQIVYKPHNLARGSETVGGSSWNLLTGGTGVAPVVTLNYAASPVGTLTASRLQLNRGAGTTSTDGSYLQQGFGLSGINNNIKSIYLKSNDGLSHKLALWDLNPGGVNPTIITVTPTWQRFSYAGQNFSGNCFIIFGLRGDQATDQTADILAWGAQFELNLAGSSTPSSYYPTTDASAYYGPRFDYDPSTLTLRGLLIEEQRTNLLLQSNGFGTTWALDANSALAASATTSPDGSSNGWKFTENTTTSGIHHFTQAITKAASALPYSATIFAKAGERARIAIQATSGSNGLIGGFDLAGGQTAYSNLIGSGFTLGTNTIQSIGNGWYRCTLNFTSDATTGLTIALYIDNGSGTGAQSTSYAGTVGSGVYIYGAQLEQAAFASSYIPTATATVTRSADAATVATSAFPFNANAGTIAVEGTFLNGNPDQFIFDIASGNESNRLFGDILSQKWRVGATASGTNYTASSSGNVTFGAVSKAAYSYTNGSISGALNESAAFSAAATLPSVSLTTVNLGSPTVTGFSINAWLGRFRYWPRLLPNATLQQKTSANDNFAVEAAA